MQGMAAFVAQNYGAGCYERAHRSLFYAMGLSLVCTLVMFYLAFFQGDLLSYIFASDCLLTCFYFCFVGYFNGIGSTRFVMIQGILGAFGIRVPLAFLFSSRPGATLFTIGLATPSCRWYCASSGFWWRSAKKNSGQSSAIERVRDIISTKEKEAPSEMAFTFLVP